MKNLATLLLLWLMATAAYAATLQGSPRSLEIQNEEAERSELSYIPDDEALERMKKGRFIVPIPVNHTLVMDPRLEDKWHFVRPWTAKFLTDLSRDFYREFREPLQINSAVRTVERQLELRHQNGNAAPHRGHRRSVHPTGAAIDIAKLGRSGPQIKWLTLRLLKLERAGLIEATEEHRQAVFHIMVMKKYGDPPKPAPERRKKVPRG